MVAFSPRTGPDAVPTSVLVLVLGGEKESRAAVSIGDSLLGHAQSPVPSRLLVSDTLRTRGGRHRGTRTGETDVLGTIGRHL